jgi:hypothetical protein
VKGSVTLSPMDFIGPQAPAAQIMAATFGINVPPEAMQAMGMFAQMWAQMQAQAAQQKAAADAAAKGQPSAQATEHGGPAQQIPPIDKHQASLTGGMQGTGMVQ